MITEKEVEAGNSAISNFMERSHIFNYHESWSLLIPVIERLTHEKFRASIYFTPSIGSTVLYDPINNRLEVTTEGPKESTIMTTWKSVVKFLEMIQKESGSNA